MNTKKPTIINLIGQMFGTSGYASHYRKLANELNKLTDCKIITNLQPGFERQVNDQELEMIKREQDYDINIVVTHPLHWRANLSAKRNFVYLIWEGDKVPKWILEECRNEKIEKIICPSEHTKQALLNTLKELMTPKFTPVLKAIIVTEDYMNREKIEKYINDKLVVIPHGYNKEDFYSQQAAKGLGVKSPVVKKATPADTFKFLANKGLRNLEDRGGLQYLINAYLSEFTESNNVELILKINPAYGVPNLLKMFPNIKKNGVPKITFIPQEYTIKQLNDLYNSCDVFVSPTRAEAFNIPCLESLACGKPVISTTFGGQTDFIKENHNGWLIDGKLTQVTHETEYEETSWLTPNMEDLKKMLRMCYTNQDIVEEVSKNCIKSIEHLTWKNCAKLILDLVKG